MRSLDVITKTSKPEPPTALDAAIRDLALIYRSMDKPDDSAARLGGITPREAVRNVAALLNLIGETNFPKAIEVPLSLTAEEKRRQSFEKTMASRRAKREKLKEEARLARTDRAHLPLFLTDVEFSWAQSKLYSIVSRIDLIEKYIQASKKLVELTDELRNPAEGVMPIFDEEIMQ